MPNLTKGLWIRIEALFDLVQIQASAQDAALWDAVFVMGLVAGCSGWTLRVRGQAWKLPWAVAPPHDAKVQTSARVQTIVVRRILIFNALSFSCSFWGHS